MSCYAPISAITKMNCIATLLVFLALLAASVNAVEDGGQVYIVYLGHLPSSDLSEPEGFSATETAHQSMLNQVLDGGSSALDRILHSYKRSLNGFAARLTEQEADRLSSMEGVVSIFPSRTHELLTTRSWDFLGFPPTPKEDLRLQGEIIIGMLDSGVWPDSPSFSDEGLSPPPSRWKGSCQNFTCNNKIIGARVYRLESSSSTGLSPRDEIGHGSHTASTVAGRAVSNVSFGGLAAGTVRGAVPGARLAIYKVCGNDGGCDDADILAAYDDAIADGVDVISYSLGDPFPLPYFTDVAAIGSFHAMKRRVLTSTAAGNDGLFGGHVTNVAPWMLSVAASSIDRRFVDKIVLGNGETIVGASINTFPSVQNATLIRPKNGSCDIHDLGGGSYEGKIVLCWGLDTDSLLLAGVAGAVISGSLPDTSFTLPLPALLVTQDQFDVILAYVNGTSNPVGTIDTTEAIVDPLAPRAASFSSPGPNMITPGILKPDISAPGIDIIASWSPQAPPSRSPQDNRRVLYNIVAGTSMACPHASGAAAYVKSFHRDWSPAMIMSALITTATPMNTPGNFDSNELKYGAGQLNPSKARDPGLVYDASESDYIAMLCAQGYNATQLALVTGSNSTACVAGTGGGDLNYPTMAAHVAPGKNFSVHFSRTVTNVGRSASAEYTMDINVLSSMGTELDVSVSPGTLKFSAENRTASYKVSVSGLGPPENEVISVAIMWSDSDGGYAVRSPLVVYTEDIHVEMPTRTP
ncbi:hypothetical protein ACP70R_046137 [Stipagrostis hirtigluma subsp. patula]